MKLKVVKLTKNDLKKHPADILKKVGAVDKIRGATFPTHVYMSKKDLDIVEANLRKSFKKANPLSRKQAIDRSVDFAMADFGPNEALAKVMVSGVALVDTEALYQEFKASADSKQIRYVVTYEKKPTLVEIVKKVKSAVVNALKFQNRA